MPKVLRGLYAVQACRPILLFQRKSDGKVMILGGVKDEVFQESAKVFLHSHWAQVAVNMSYLSPSSF